MFGVSRGECVLSAFELGRNLNPEQNTKDRFVVCSVLVFRSAFIDLLFAPLAPLGLPKRVGRFGAAALLFLFLAATSSAGFGCAFRWRAFGMCGSVWFYGCWFGVLPRQFVRVQVVVGFVCGVGLCFCHCSDERIVI